MGRHSLITKGLRGLLVIFCVFLAVACLLLTTTLGAQCIFGYLQKIVPGNLQCNSMTGSLSSTLSCRDLSYHDDNVQLDSDYLRIQLNLWALLHLKLAFVDLQSTGVDINLIPADTTNEQPTNQDTDIAYYFKHITSQHIFITDLLVHQKQQTLLQLTQLETKQISDHRHLMTLFSDKGTIAGYFELLTNPSFAWNANFKLMNLNPAYYTGNNHDRINCQITSNGEYEKVKRFTLSINDVSGNIANYPLSARINAHYNNGTTIIPESYINIANTKSVIRGKIGKHWDMQWNLISPEINRIFPNYKGQVSFKGTIDGERLLPIVHADVLANDLDLRVFNLKRLSGHLDIDSLDVNQLSGQFHLNTSQLRIADQFIPDVTMQMQLHYAAHTLSSRFRLDFTGDNSLSGDITLPACNSLTDLSQPILGKVKLQFPRLEQFAHVYPDYKNLQGRLIAYIDLNGIIAKPNMVVNAAISQGQFPIKPLGITLTDVNLTANGSQSLPLRFKGRFKSGGNATIVGAWDINLPSYPLDVTVIGSHLQLTNSPQYKINITPHIHLSYINHHYELTGQVEIPSADINIGNTTDVQTLPDDVTFVSGKPSGLNLLKLFSIHLELTLGNDIHVAASGLNSQLAGKLALNKEENSEITASGELFTNNGTYKAYGRELAIRQGRLIYTGNLLDNPGLNIEATKTFPMLGSSTNSLNDSSMPAFNSQSTLIAGVRVRGTMLNPTVTLFSEPGGLGQEDILSYLIFGYPRSQIGSLSGLALLNDVAMDKNSGGKNIQSLAANIQKSLGISSVGFKQVGYTDPTTNSSGTTTAMSVEKKLGKKLSLHYSMGLFKPVSVLNLRYQLRRDVYFQAESSMLESGADLFYEIERD